MFKWLRHHLQRLTIFEVFTSLTIIVLTVFIIKYFGQKVDWKIIRVEIINKSWAENYNPYGYRTPFWLSDKLKIGQKEYDKSGNVIAEIIDIENYERGSEEAEVYLTLKVKTSYQKRTRQALFKNKPLDLGSAIEISPDQNLIFGQVVDTSVPPSGYPKKTFTVTTRGRGVDPYIYEKIKIGESMNNRYTQQPVLTISDFRTENTSRIYVNEITDNNRTLGFKLGPNNKDIVVKFNVVGHQIDGRWYFAGHQHIKVGGTVYFYGKSINLYALEIENVE